MKIKLISAVFFLIFAAFAGLQFNDPDPVLWVLLYGIVALFSLLRIFGYYHKYVLVILMIIIGGFSLMYLPGMVEWLVTPHKEEIFGEMVYEKPYIEETREFFGLVLAFLALWVHYKVK